VKVVIDTNVVAYYLLRTEPFHQEARDLWAAVKKPIAPAFWAAEFANAVWSVTRAGVIAPADALDRLRMAGLLGIESVDVTTLWAGAVSRAIEAGHPAYDTLFVELAHRQSAPLATFDQKVLDRFPEVAIRPATLLARSPG
jgi:predicted nucleic acid-binding protein